MTHSPWKNDENLRVSTVMPDLDDGEIKGSKDTFIKL